MTTATVSDKALLAAPKDATPPASEMLVKIARDFGVNPLRQWKEMMLLSRGPGKLAAEEYVSSGAFKTEFDMAAKKEFIGKRASLAMNNAANHKQYCAAAGFVRDKALYSRMLNDLGLRSTRTQAVVHARRRLGDMTLLADADQVVRFLKDGAKYPIFGKPVNGTRSIGSVLIESLDAKTGQLLLGNGREIDAVAFANEIFTDYPDGYLFQDALKQHPELVNAVGGSIGAMRILTIRERSGISTLYKLWKIPSPTAMSDNFWQDGSMIALINDHGQVEKCMTGQGPDHREIEEHPVTGARFKDLTIPHFKDALALAEEAHAVFPEFGFIGWDMAICEDGPTIIEANDNPLHVMYQLASGHGVRNAEFAPRFDAVIAETERLIAEEFKIYQTREELKKA